MEKQIICNIDKTFSENPNNFAMMFWRVYIYLNLNDTFVFEKFRNVITLLNNRVNFNILLVENEPFTFNGNDLYFLYKKDENQLLFMCNHKYYDGRLISHVFQCISKAYDEIYYNTNSNNYMIQNNNILDLLKNVNRNIQEINTICLPYYILNKITDVINSEFIHCNFNIDKNIKLNKINYDPKNFNTIDFITFLQDKYNTNMLVMMNISKYITEDIIYGNLMGFLEIKPQENVRQKIQSINKTNYKNIIINIPDITNFFINFFLMNIGKPIIFINSLKNMFLPSFVDNINPLEFLQSKTYDSQLKIFGVMPTDKNNNTYVYSSEIL